MLSLGSVELFKRSRDLLHGLFGRHIAQVECDNDLSDA
jgi:hypothetical protein